MKELTWNEIFELDDNSLRDYIEKHNPPLPIPIIPVYGENDILDKWVYDYIMEFPFKNGTLKYRESLCIPVKYLHEYTKKYNIEDEELTKEDYEAMGEMY